MKNKKGFTLVELLAIIVILAVIMVIAVPKILDVVNGTKNSAWKDNVGMIKKAIVTNSQLIDVETGTYKYSIDKLCSDPSKVKEVVKLEDTTVTCSGNVFSLTGTGQFVGKSATITCTNKNCSVSILDSSVALAPGLYDGNNNLIATWDELINTYGMDLSFNPPREEPTYVYIAPTFLNSMLNSSNGAYTEAGWYERRRDVSTDQATKVDINTINSMQPAVILGKLIGNTVGSKLVIDGSLQTVPHGLGGSNIEHIIINDGPTAIEDNAFEGLTNLKSIIISNTVTEIGDEAFEGDTSLAYVKLSDNLKTLGGEAFAGCESLTSITLPNTLEMLYMAFADTMIENITIPSSVKVISRMEFLYDTNLKSITFEDPNNWGLASWGFGYSCAGCDCRYNSRYDLKRAVTPAELVDSNFLKNVFATSEADYNPETYLVSDATVLAKTNIDWYEYGKIKSGFYEHVNNCTEDGD